jgi:hypothetical protein
MVRIMTIDAARSPGELALAGLLGLGPDGRPDRAAGAAALLQALERVARAVLRRESEESQREVAAAALLRVWPTHTFRGQSPGEAFQYLRRVVWSTFVDQRAGRSAPAVPGAGDDAETVDCPPPSEPALDPLDANDAREFLTRLGRVRVKLLLLSTQDARPGRPGPYISLRFYLDECLALSDTPGSPAPRDGAEASTWRYRGQRSARALVQGHAEHFADDTDVVAAIFGSAPTQGQDEPPLAVSPQEEPQ